jgi:hypothetical protein
MKNILSWIEENKQQFEGQEPRNMAHGGIIPPEKPKLPQLKIFADKLKTYLNAGAIKKDYATQLLKEKMDELGVSDAELGTITGRRGEADGGRIIGKPGGLVEPGVEYYATEIYKIQQGAHKDEWALPEQTFDSKTKKKSTKVKYFKSKTDLNNYLKETKTPPKYSKTELNKAAQHFFNKNYNEIDSKQQAKAYQRIRSGEGKFSKVTQADPLTTIQQNKILKEYPNAKFTPTNKFGFPPGHENYQKVTAFVSRDYKKPFQKTQLQALPRYAQKELIEAFREVDFNFNRDTLLRKGSQFSKYGVPVSHPKYQKISKYFAKSKIWKYNFDLRSPEGWMMSQMERNYAQNGEASPYRPITKNGGPIAKGNPMIGIEHNGKKYNMKTIVNHADFDNTKKYWNIADKTSKKYLSEFDNLAKLLPEGFDPKKIQVNDLLQFIGDKDGIKGLNRAKRAIQIHHEYGVGPRATTNYQLLRQDMNLLANKANNLIKSGKLSNIEEGAAKALERNTRLVVNDVRYGPKKVSATGDIKTIISQAETEMKGLTKKDWNKFGNLFRQLCPKGKASGGRIGYDPGGAVGGTLECGLNVIKNNNIKTEGQARTMLKIAEAGSKSKALRGLLGVWGLGGEAIIEAGIGAYKVLGQGVPADIAWSESYWSYLDPRKYTGELSDLRKKDLEKGNPRIAKYFDALGVLEKKDYHEKWVNQTNPDDPSYEYHRNKLNQYNEVMNSFYGGPSGITKMLERVQPEVDEAEAIQAGRWAADAMPSTEVQADRKQKQAMKELMESHGVKTKPHTKDGKPVYEIDKALIDTDLKMFGDYYGYGWTPYGHGYGMQQKKPGIGDMKYNEDLGYRELIDDMMWNKGMDNLSRGAAKIAGGGRVGYTDGGLTRTVAPDSGPMSQGLRSLYINDMDY